ncbi:diguanylate cyclase [Clostridium sp. Sa3CUN1]|uniref:Diguanylate cyclase n=1 Tax=Clostridium gallinarum TaxID=2762246 RepID=A0ABR8Q0M7_9CLOT|nr:GGDEF domain-containing protein [Clostridium gallinarum]MBD7913964.1 diguanylate cyclase [Clostridium gallinarum]
MKYLFPNNIKKLNKIILILSIILISFNFFPKHVKAEENKVIKVGYPIVEGFTEIKDEIYSGYAFEYLMEISKYTGWQYEFIEMGLNDALNKLKDGEIDIVAGMIKNEKTSELFDFPNSNSGYTYAILATLENNNNISRSDYHTLNGITVGYFDKYEENLKNLKTFFDNNNITNVSYKSYPSNDSKALITALNNKEVDAITTGELTFNIGLKILAKYSSSPYYFATTKGNTELVEGLDNAIHSINFYSPNFTAELYLKYFDNKRDTSIIFNEEEKEYLSNLDTLKAIYVDDFKPVQFYDKASGEPKGIIVDVGKMMAKNLGLPLELIRADSYADAYKLLQENSDYIIIGVPIYYSSARLNNIIYTKSYLDLDIVKVYSKKAPSNKEDQILALPYGYGYSDLNSGYKIEYYDTLDDCLNAVENNKASLTYGNYYSISSYISNNYFSNLSIVRDSSYSIQGSSALSENANRTFFNIINKAIASISDAEIKNIIYSNSTNFKSPITIKSFFLSNLALCLTIISIIVVTIILLIVIIIKLKFKKEKHILLAKSQIDYLSGLYNRNACEDLIKTYLNTNNSSYYSSFIIIDIDHFKQVNDKFGHQTGDILLKDFSQLLKEIFSHKDIIGRLGGDEFIVFMKDINTDNLNIIEEKLENLRCLMDKEISLNNDTQKISLSIGAIITNKSTDFDRLYHEADKILYEVKRNGRNGFKIKQDF